MRQELAQRSAAELNQTGQFNFNLELPVEELETQLEAEGFVWNEELTQWEQFQS